MEEMTCLGALAWDGRLQSVSLGACMGTEGTHTQLVTVS